MTEPYTTITSYRKMPVLQEIVEEIFYAIVHLAQLYFEEAINADEFQENLWELLIHLHEQLVSEV